MKRVSNSELKAFKECRRRWYLTYVRRLKLRREDPTGAASIGTRVHAVLAAYYEQVAQGRDLLALGLHDHLVGLDLADFPDDADDIRKEADLSRAICEGYFEWLEETGADEGLVIVAPEQKLEAEILPGVMLQGKIDIRVQRETDGARMVLDHKTVQEFTTPTRVLHLDEQMKTYLLLERLNDPAARTDGAIYNMLRKVKRTARATPPFYDRLEVRHNVHVMRDFYERIVAEITDIVETERLIEKGETWRAYPNPSRDCAWKCPFFGVCGLMDDPTSGAEQMIEALYEVGDPYARYEEIGSSDG
jgi:RecB family exonuclease